MVWSMMCFTDLPISFWGYALETAGYILNRVPSKVVSSTPYALWKTKNSSLKHLKIWDYPTYVKNNFGHKLSVRSEKYRFAGYP